MFCPNPEVLLILAREYRGERLRDAETIRLLKEVQSRRTGLYVHLLLKLGDFLIALGLWLRKRYQVMGQPVDTSVLRVS